VWGAGYGVNVSQYVRSWQNSEWDISKSEVKLEDGLLKITIPKTVEAQETVIDIT
jgi:HSP20 family molecular chaperone IbpA